MKLSHTNQHLRYLLALLSTASALQYSNDNRILLSKVKTLTLRNDQFTTARRTSAIPQLKCVGGPAKGLYEIDVMRCTNMGSDYGGEDVTWSCTADVPRFFKLGSTDVYCEGYNSPDDTSVLKGSCGVEYRLTLTDAGYEKYGKRASYSTWFQTFQSWYSTIFVALFWSVVAFFVYSAYKYFLTAQNTGRRPPGPRFGARRPWFGGWGDDDDAPPPYDPRPPPRRYNKPSYTTSGQQQEWRPGFWSGIAAGAAGSYLMGGANRNREREVYRQPDRPLFGGFGGGGGGGGSSFVESSGAGAARHETTGFGQTRRR